MNDHHGKEARCFEPTLEDLVAGGFVNHFVYPNQTGSTNQLAKTFDDPHGDERATAPVQTPRNRRSNSGDRWLFITDRQTDGRGRGDRQWESPPGSIALSWRSLTDGPPDGRSAIAAGVVTARAIENVSNVPIGLKWPNDLIGPGGSKLGGILIEGVRQQARWHRIIGIGINASSPPKHANQPAEGLELPLELRIKLLRELVTGLSVWTRDERSNREDLGQSSHEQSDTKTHDASAADWIAAYRERCVLTDQWVRCSMPDGRTIVGNCDGVDEEGRLKVADSAGEIHVLHGGDIRRLRTIAET